MNHRAIKAIARRFAIRLWKARHMPKGELAAFATGYNMGWGAGRMFNKIGQHSDGQIYKTIKMMYPTPTEVQP